MKKYKALLELVAQEETPHGAMEISKNIELIDKFGKLATKLGFDCYMKGYPKEKLEYEPTGKTYEIATLDDIVEHLDEKQFEFFVDDLRNWFQIMKSAKALEDTGLCEIESKPGMTWLDTGLNESHVKMEISTTNKVNKNAKK